MVLKRQIRPQVGTKGLIYSKKEYANQKGAGLAEAKGNECHRDKH